MDNSHDIIYGLAEVALFLTNQCGRTDYSQTIEDACSELSKHRWIPVSERLPEYTGTFLVWVGINQCGEGMHMECRTAMFYYPMQRFYVHYEVEAELVSSVEKWMPLPEPPKDGEWDG